MTPDNELIDAAYNDALKKVFAGFFDQYLQAGGSAAEETIAEQNFTHGVTIARRVHERAIALLP